MFDIDAVMTLCINPKCTQPENSDHNLECRNCGSELLLEGLYRASKKLGEGGFGVTYLVRDNHQNFEKVLKILKLEDPDALRLFEQEAEVLKKLNHPGIPHVESDGYFSYFARDSQKPIHCLIMEKIEGEDLETWLNKRQQPINQRVALNWLKELTEILQVVHQEQFFHRDIKPSNIMLKPNGRLALIDFGTVKEATVTYMAKAEAGKPGTIGIDSTNYTPTEQQNGCPVPQSDFFALGRTFVHLLTKQPLGEFYDAHTDTLNWQYAAPNIDPLLKNFIDQLMQRLVKDRPANTTVILQELEKIERKLYPPKVTTKPTVIQTPPKQISPRRKSLNKKRKSSPVSKPKSKIRIFCELINSNPWLSLLPLSLNFICIAIALLMVSSPLWGWIIVGIITMFFSCLSFESDRELDSNFNTITLLIIWSILVFCAVIEPQNFPYVFLLPPLMFGMFLFNDLNSAPKLNRYFSKVQTFFIVTTTSFGGLGLGVLVVWLWQYLV